MVVDSITYETILKARRFIDASQGVTLTNTPELALVQSIEASRCHRFLIANAKQSKTEERCVKEHAERRSENESHIISAERRRERL